LKTRATYWIKEENLLKWLFIVLTPLFIGIVVALIDNNFAIWLPSLCMYQCGNWEEVFEARPVPAYHTSINLAVVALASYEFVLCSVFFACVFWLRNIHDEFSVSQEIKRMSLTLYLCDTLYIASLIFLYDTPFVVLGFVQYFQVAICLALLGLTASSIRKSYKPNTIIPFPLTE